MSIEACRYEAPRPPHIRNMVTCSLRRYRRRWRALHTAYSLCLPRQGHVPQKLELCLSIWERWLIADASSYFWLLRISLLACATDDDDRWYYAVDARIDARRFYFSRVTLDAADWWCHVSLNTRWFLASFIWRANFYKIVFVTLNYFYILLLSFYGVIAPPHDAHSLTGSIYTLMVKLWDRFLMWYKKVAA